MNCAHQFEKVLLAYHKGEAIPGGIICLQCATITRYPFQLPKETPTMKRERLAFTPRRYHRSSQRHKKADERRSVILAELAKGTKMSEIGLMTGTSRQYVSLVALSNGLGRRQTGLS